MRIEVEIAARRRIVDVRREAGGWVVTLDGRELSASVAEAGGRWSLLLASSGDAPRSYEVALDAPGPAEHVVHVNGHAVPVALPDPRHGRRGRAGRDAASGARAVVAPMPGRIVKVLVEPGQRVTARQGLVVVEAMKMENELRAPRAATVAEVHAREGATVEANAVLVALVFDE